MIVVGDASVFIALERIGEQDLLRRVYGQVHVPDAVWREVFLSEAGDSVATAPDWIVRHTVELRAAAGLWPETLDEGESEAILLARELPADLLLLDEAAGRSVSRRLGLNVTGVLGLLIEAKRQGKIEAVKPRLEKRRESGFWLANSVLKEALRRAGEQVN